MEAEKKPEVRYIAPSSADAAAEFWKDEGKYIRKRWSEAGLLNAGSRERGRVTINGGEASSPGGDGDAEQPRPKLAGLALSGGGIRSATFCLGALQALAHKNVLRAFDYMSTVSGGGYIGGSLSWYWGTRQGGLGPADFPFGTDDPAAPNMPSGQGAKRPLSHLRNRANYLMPGDGITIGSGVGAVLRSSAVNLLLILGILFALISALMLVGYVRWDWACVSEPASGGCEIADLRYTYPVLLLIPAVLGLVAILIFTLSLIAYWLVTGGPRKPEKMSSSEDPPSVKLKSYKYRRMFDVHAWKLAAIGLPLTAIGALPLAAALVTDAGGPVAAAFGMISALRIFKGGGSSLSKLVIARVGAVILLLSLPLIAYSLAEYYVDWAGRSSLVSIKSLSHLSDVENAVLAFLNMKAVQFGAISHPGTWGLLGTGLAAGLILLAVLLVFMAVRPNFNLVTLHRFYRDRLMEAFMAPGAAPASTDPDKFNIGELNTLNDAVPYHLINTNVVITKVIDKAAPGLKRAERRAGDNFILSRFLCGSSATGWLDTSTFMAGQMSLASAVAVSGAAVNPDAAGGGGLARSWGVSALLGVLQLRLGLWVPNPRRWFEAASRITNGAEDSVALRNALEAEEGSLQPNFWRVGWREALACRQKVEGRSQVELADGGHFENLGIYELVRRRVDFILVVDATADPKCTMSDLMRASTLVHQDFGAVIDVPLSELKELMSVGRTGYPLGLKSARRPFVRGTVTYPASGGRESYSIPIYILTTVLTKGVGSRLLGYTSDNPDFPDNSTGDQFFDEIKFEAYRELGYKLAMDMMTSGDPSRPDFNEEIEPYL
ncbi:MAG TPA: patatin-like phospholipase family protein [Azospirillaceae bacterium]|nr:patatin-like phospholipase family protein [Azospirillaceae bacterium]